MDLIKYDMTDIWAVAGDVVSPDSTKIRQGWGVEVVPRQWWNWFENRQDNNIAYLLQKGIPEWDSTTEYIVNKSYVVRNGIVYRATLTSTGSDPVSLVSWARAFADYSTASNALSGVTPVSGTLPYFDTDTTAATTTLTPFARTLLAATTAPLARTTLGAQASSLTLSALSLATPSTNKIAYFTSNTTADTTDITTFGRSVIGASDAEAGRTLLGVVSGTEISTALAGKQDKSSVLTTLAAITPSNNQIVYFTSQDTATTTPITGYTRTLLAVTNEANARTTLGLGNISTQNSNSITITGGTITGITDLAVTDGGTGASTALSARENLGTHNAVNLTTGILPEARLSGTYSISVTGNAASANKLTTARSINGILFDGTSDITVADSSKLPLTGGNLSGIVNTSSTITGGYGSTTGTGNSWGGTIWAMGPAYAGSTSGSAYSTAGVYGLSWLRSGSQGEGLYLSLNGTLNGAIGATGIYTVGSVTATGFSGSGASLTSLNADNISSGVLSVGVGGTGTTTATGTGSTVRQTNPALAGVPTTPTAAAGTNTTQIASTAFVSTGLALKANLASPAFTGTPTGPTAVAGTSTTQLATTAFVQSTVSRGQATAFVTFNAVGGSIAIRDSFNVSSVVILSEAQYTVNFATPMASTSYLLAGSANLNGTFVGWRVVAPISYTTTSCIVATSAGGGYCQYIDLVFFGGK